MELGARVVLRYRQLSQVFVQVPRAELALRHKRLNGFLQGVAIDDGQKVVGLVSVLTGNPIEEMVDNYPVVSDHGGCRLAGLGVNHSHSAAGETTLPFQLRRQFAHVV